LSITALEFVVLVLAAFRATQLVTRDTILDGPRERFIIWVENRGWGKLGDLVECGFCAGYWLSGISLLVFLLLMGRWDAVPWLVHGIEWFAVAGGQGLLSQVLVTSGEEAKAAGEIADELDDDAEEAA
jgi:hypothetical protein